MDKQKVYDECMGYAKEFVQPYLVADVCEIDKNDHISFSYYADYLPDDKHYDVHEDLCRFIALSIWRLTGQLIPPRLCSHLVPLLDICKDPKDYQHIIRIIFCMIRSKIYSKNDFVDALKDTTNIPALMEIIKYDDFTVMTDSHRFEV